MAVLRCVTDLGRGATIAKAHTERLKEQIAYEEADARRFRPWGQPGLCAFATIRH